MPAGEVVTSFASDFWRMGNVFDVTARFAGAIVSFVVVSIILLRGSMVLGVIMLVGGPLLLASLTLVMRPLQRRQAAQRQEAGLLTSLGADTVGGPAGAARHRRRGHLPDPVRRPVRPGAGRGGAAVRHPGDPRRRPGAAARRLRRHRDGRRRPPRRRGRHHTRPARRVLRLHGVPHHAAAHGDRVRRQADPHPGGGPPDRHRSSVSSPTTRRPRRAPPSTGTWSTTAPRSSTR